jgi:hypothetical protein
MIGHRTLAAVAAAVLVALARTPSGAQERDLPAVGDRVRIAWRVVATRWWCAATTPSSGWRCRSRRWA